MNTKFKTIEKFKRTDKKDIYDTINFKCDSFEFVYQLYSQNNQDDFEAWIAVSFLRPKFLYNDRSPEYQNVDIKEYSSKSGISAEEAENFLQTSYKKLQKDVEKYINKLQTFTDKL